MEGIWAAWRFKLLEWFHSDIQGGHHGSHLENFSNHICSRTVCLIELKLDGRHWGVMEIFSELLKLFCSNIQDGHSKSD